MATRDDYSTPEWVGCDPCVGRVGLPLLSPLHLVKPSVYSPPKNESPTDAPTIIDYPVPPALGAGKEFLWDADRALVNAADCFGRDAAAANTAPTNLPHGAGYTNSTATSADTSPKISSWLADDAGLANGRLRTLREVQDAADRVLESTGAGDVVGPTVFATDDGRVYSVRVVAVVEEADPKAARRLIEDALATCPPTDTTRRLVLESHLRHLAVL